MLITKGPGMFKCSRTATRANWDSDLALAEDFIESTGVLDSMPDNLRGYFDTEAFTHNLMMDYSESGGHCFRNI